MKISTTLGPRARRTVLTTGKTYRCKSGKMTVLEYRHGEYTVRTESGWVQRIHGVWEFPDGHIEWDYSAGGHWEEAEK